MAVRWIGKLTAVVMCAVLAVDLVIGYGWYQQRQKVQRTGFTARSYVAAGGVEYGYVVFVPYDLPDDERPALLMFLNGRGQNGDDGVQQISNNFGRPLWEMRQRFPFVCLAPQCSEEGNWDADSPDSQAALAILDQVIEEYGIDPDRVYLTGVSSGGNGVFSIAAANPEKFAAIVPLAGASSGRPVEEAADLYAQGNLPIWNFYNGGDKEGLVSFNRRLQEELIARGLSPVFVEYDQEGHNCWEWAYRTPAMYDWLSRQDRRVSAERTKFRVIPLDARLSDWRADSEGSWSADEGVLRIDQPEGSDTHSTLMYKSAVGDFELHFDYRSDEGRGFEIVLQSTSEPVEDVRVVIVWPEEGTGGVVVSEPREWLSGTQPLAQQSLARGQWNDVRVRRLGERLSTQVNGLWLVDVPETGINGPVRFGFRVDSASDDGAWRFVRVRSRRGEGEGDES